MHSDWNERAVAPLEKHLDLWRRDKVSQHEIAPIVLYANEGVINEH